MEEMCQRVDGGDRRRTSGAGNLEDCTIYNELQ